jgi:hypothetical protein
MEETVFLQEGNITVTNSRVVVPAQTYAMSGITSVKSMKETPSRKGPIILIIIGVLALAGGKDAVAGGLIFLLAGIAWWALHKPTYWLVLHSASGESKAFTNKDVGFISRIVEAINNAIIHRG